MTLEAPPSAVWLAPHDIVIKHDSDTIPGLYPTRRSTWITKPRSASSGDGRSQPISRSTITPSHLSALLLSRLRITTSMMNNITTRDVTSTKAPKSSPTHHQDRRPDHVPRTGRQSLVYREVPMQRTPASIKGRSNLPQSLSGLNNIAVMYQRGLSKSISSLIPTSPTSPIQRSTAPMGSIPLHDAQEGVIMTKTPDGAIIHWPDTDISSIFNNDDPSCMVSAIQKEVPQPIPAGAGAHP